MGRQLKRAFKSRAPKQQRFHASRVALNVRRVRHTLGGVMIVPPPPGSERLIDREMKKIRAVYIKEMGQAGCDNHVKKVNEEFKNLLGRRGVRM
ncbi:hypothetical protein [Paenibacillus sp. A3M_27_13]|uniref:hypothetical protein n=1 Tax=Paenibacillus sp. A3M_27_13 TaxID=2962029 RepID=UPI0020B6B718|nr:hypothetical protein [Paenibacillus sp. A3M_27_13]MCP3746771.1 hypothetical protein [Paenibacillus sp. A3M_27_13]